MQEFPFIRAVHYFGDQWPKTFWSSFTLANVAGDFEQIANDGYNAIILVAPTRMFNGADGEMSRFYIRRLKHCLAEAERLGLGVILRVAYPNDIIPANTEIVPRSFYHYSTLIHLDEAVYQAFLEHLACIRSLIADFRNVLFVFMTWEDSWGAMKIFPTLELEERRRLSRRLGFSDYVNRELSPELKAALGIDMHKTTEVPETNDPRFSIYKAFYDGHMAKRFILPARRIFDRLGYEVRVDAQKVVDFRGEQRWVHFSGYPDLDIVTCSYWAPFMGRINQGEVIEADLALKSLRATTDRVRRDSGRRPFVDQFNFVTGTAAYEANSAKIEPSQLEDFLTRALEFMRTETIGYGLWAYRDYRENCIVNGCFEHGLFNWKIAGRAEVQAGVRNWLQLKGPCTLRTNAFLFKGKKLRPFRLTFELDRNATSAVGVEVTVRFLSCRWNVALDTTQSAQELLLEGNYRRKGEPETEPFTIEFRMGDGDLLTIRNLQLYDHVLSNGLYTVDNRPRPTIEWLRRFNYSCEKTPVTNL